MRITQHLTAARFGACSPVRIMTGVFAPMLLWAVALPASGEEITGQALETSLQNQGWQVQHQPDGSSLVLPPDQAGKEFVFREQTPEELVQDTAGDAATENQPVPSPAPAAEAEPTKAATPAKTRPSTVPPTHPRYSRTGPSRYWGGRPPYRSRAWQRYRHHRGARYPWRGYGYRRGPRYGYSRYYAPPYGPAAPVE